MDKVLRRCSICDYFEADGGSGNRRFYLDRKTNETHCQSCAYAIRDDLGFNYWNTEKSYKDSSRENSIKAIRKAKEARDFSGYEPGEVSNVDIGFDCRVEIDGDSLWGVSSETPKTMYESIEERQDALGNKTSIPGPRGGAGSLRERRAPPPKRAQGRFAGPTSADLDAIEAEWEDLLKEMDLGTLTDVD